MRKVGMTAVEAVGFALVVGGFALVYVPLSLIVAGFGLIWAATVAEGD